MSTYTITSTDTTDLTSPLDIAAQVTTNPNYVLTDRDQVTGDVTIERMDGERLTFNTEEETTTEETETEYIDTVTITGFTYSITDADGDIYDTHGWPVTTTADLDRAQDTITEFLNNTTC